MLGRKERDQLELLITGSLRQLIPDDHVLVRVDRILDLSWLRDEVADLYCLDDGRPGIDPEVAVRLMLAGLLNGIVHDRKLMREAHVNIAIRWFVGYGVHEQLPDHSSLTRIRQRWGADRFRKIFKRTVEACLQAKIATGEIVHVDASLIRANVSWESLIERHVVEVLDENNVEVEKQDRQSSKSKKVCVTDPDATMATNARNRHLEPCYKQHAAVDDKAGVILDVEVTTGEKNEGEMLTPQVDEVKATTGVDIKTVTADAGYAYAKVYGALERRSIDALIPAKAEPIRSRVPMRRFRYDAKHDILKCPRGRVLRATRPVKHGRFFYSKARDCACCPIKGDCLSKGRVNKAVVVGDDYPALLRARRRRDRWSDQDRRLYQRHRWRSEGFHGEAKSWHGLARAIRRGLANMRIQAYLTAAAINLKRLAAALLALTARLVGSIHPIPVPTWPPNGPPAARVHEPVTAQNDRGPASSTTPPTTPIVFVIGGDPVAQGLVTSLNRPGGNLTGLTFFGNRLGAKRLEMLRELVPGSKVIAALIDPNFPEAVAEWRAIEEAGHTIGQKIVLVNARNAREFDTAFSIMVQAGTGGLVVIGSPLFTSKRQALIVLSALHAIPAIYDQRDYVIGGGLISYSASFTDAYRQAGNYTGRILKGEKPWDLPVLQPTKYELTINLKTAKRLDLTFPQSLLASADEVIE